VPSAIECNDCHKGRKDILLGFEAISLAQPAATGLTLAALAQENRLAPPPAKTSLTVDPGLGVLHVNCGVSCHNATPGANGKDSTLRLRIGFDEASSKPVASWQMMATMVNVPATLPAWSGGPRLAPGAPEKSVLVTTMKARGTGQMPPSTQELDFAGIAAVEGFVRGFPPR
jgi:mono/diheme cytochrome c family protein